MPDSNAAPTDAADRAGSTFGQIAAGYGVHLLTTSGIIPAALAMMEIVSDDCRPVVVFAWLLLAVFIDAIDGPLARKVDVWTHAPSIDGRTIDDLLDYLTFAFIPLTLIWRMGWMPDGTGATVIAAMGASLLGFSHVRAKDDAGGFFRGFPSYWNALAVYAGVFSTTISPWLTAALVWSCTVLTVCPVWVLYPNKTAGALGKAVLIGSVVWTAAMLAMLAWDYPRSPMWLTVVSLVYPALYVFASWRARSQNPNHRPTAPATPPDRS